MEYINISGKAVTPEKFVEEAIADLNKFYPGKNLKLWLHRNKPYTEPDGTKYQVGIRVEGHWTDIVSEIFYVSEWATWFFTDSQRILFKKGLLLNFKGWDTILKTMKQSKYVVGLQEGL